MARAGLWQGWTCLFANDIDAKKGGSYGANWGNEHLKIEDVGALSSKDLPGVANLAWASFPCQDLSLAGSGAGLNGERSGTFWPFWRLVQKLGKEGRAPSLVVLVKGFGSLASRGRNDFTAIAPPIVRGEDNIAPTFIDPVPVT